jgi:hypothetical protein
MDSLDKLPLLRKTDMRFDTRNVRSLYSAGYLMTVVIGERNIKMQVIFSGSTGGQVGQRWH